MDFNLVCLILSLSLPPSIPLSLSLSLSLPTPTPPTLFLLLDGIDFNSSLTGELMFPPGSSVGDIQCLTINLLSDLLVEADENFVLELFTSDPAVSVPESADIAVFTINDVLDPRGK